MREISFLDTQPQKRCSGMLVLTYRYSKKAKKDWCEKKTCIVSEVAFCTTSMPAYLQLPNKPTMVNLKDLNDDC